ncbi:MAG: bifunctional tetrahydrofolate synthase/dihydrofolate synthase [Betaproteobacteria bacterium]|nr:MAG: bifunctional tetrahydrofolate synthase/dihydrofolate synthase [Betaproteobacteria bacterium]
MVDRLNTSSAPTALSDWLSRIFAIRSGPEIEMGLERIRPVFDALKVAPSCPVFLVAGTNGKGSVCAYLDSILRAGGYRVARYTSPHIHRFNERIVVSGVEASDAALVAAFERVEAARIQCGELALTFFEYTTLAAFVIFAEAKLDAWVIEVGLGGRLDATNILEPDCSIIVSIGIDHQEFLGNTRELIAVEKAGILRRGKPAVIAEPNPPQTLIDAAKNSGAIAQFMGQDFAAQKSADMPGQWSFRSGNALRHALPIPALRGSYQLGNAAAALAALAALQDRLPVSQSAIKSGLLSVEWPGRFQVLPGRPTVVLDVAHNEHAAIALERALSDMAYFPTTHAVFSMLKDKDVSAVIAAVKHRVDCWYVAPLPGARGSAVEPMLEALRAAGVKDVQIQSFSDVSFAYAAAQKKAEEADRIIVFGSFLTVAAAMAH